MSVGRFMDLLECRGVTFDWREGAVVIEVPPDVLSVSQRDELVRRYDEVEAMVRSASVRWQPETAAAAVILSAQLPLGQAAA